MKKSNKTQVNEMVMTVPKIDKITIVIDIPELHYAKAISQNVWDELKDTKSGWVQPYSNGSYNTSAKIFCPDKNGEINTKEPHMLLQIRTKGKYNPHLRIEYNPAKIPEKLYDHLDWSFNGITGQSFFETISHGRVTRLDVCADIWDVNPDDFMLKVKYAKHSQSIFGQSGDLETIMFGKSKGTQYSVYKKALQEYGADAGGDIMRIECRLRKAIPIQQLSLIDNPFKRVQIFNLKPAKQPKVHIGHWSAFVDSVRYRGSVSTALKKQPTDVRAKLKYCLSKNMFAGWKPDNLWGDKWLTVLNECHLLNLSSPMPLNFKTATGEDWGEPPPQESVSKG